MYPQIVLVFLSLFRFNLAQVKVVKSDPVKIRGFSISDYIKENGYPFELHRNLRTPDGYLLDIQRIPHGRANETRPNPKPMLLMHGLAGTAEDWLVLPPNETLAFFLANNGYDVWMGNTRGTPHSRKHVNLDPDRNDRFWDFSFHEIAIYDVSTMIDYILKVTGKKKLSYVGHSMGTTVFFILMADRPQYNSKIEIMAAMAPAAFVLPLKITYNAAVYPITIFNELTKTAAMTEIKVRDSDSSICVKFVDYICFPLLTDIGRATMANSDPAVWRRAKQIFPVGASLKAFCHYIQSFLNGDFLHYDNGPQENLKRYNSTAPPPYNLKNIKAPVILFYGILDTTTISPAVLRLSAELPNLVENYMVPSPTFSHLDYIGASNAKELVYDKLLQFMQDH